MPSKSTVTIAYVIYALHLFSAVTGLLSPALIITAFLTGWPSIIAVLLSYWKREDARGTYLESHFTWVLKTFWVALFLLVASMLLFITVVGLPLAVIVLLGTGIWVLYRLAKGFLALVDEKPLVI